MTDTPLEPQDVKTHGDLPDHFPPMLYATCGGRGDWLVTTNLPPVRSIAKLVGGPIYCIDVLGILTRLEHFHDVVQEEFDASQAVYDAVTDKEHVEAMARYKWAVQQVADALIEEGWRD